MSAMKRKADFSEADPKLGLTKEEVAARKKAGYSNESSAPKTKSVPRILREHFFTLFNLLNAAMALVLFFVGSYKNMLFIGVAVANVAIGIFQELRAKFATDALSVIASAKVRAVRDGSETEIPFEEIVYGDILKLSIGNQIPAECEIISGEVEVNESFLTGEAEPITKSVSDTMLPGSFIVAGECVCRASAVGKENLIQKLQAGTKEYKKKNSEIILSLKKIINVVTVLVVPYFFLFYWLQTARGAEVIPAINKTIAAMVGMIPEGLILLVSSIMALSVYRLSKRKILVKELYSVESLARTDVLCLDKTGTLTDGKLSVRELRTFGHASEQEIRKILRGFTVSMPENGTLKAVREYLSGHPDRTDEALHVKATVPFSSARKFSMFISDDASYVMGAPEFVLRPEEAEIKSAVSELSRRYRVVAIAKSPSCRPDEKSIPEERTTVGLLMISESLRQNTAETMDYFQRQDVTIKVISGDSPATVSSIAQSAGIRNAEKYIDMSTVGPGEDYAAIARNYAVFGRVSPVQKKQLVQGLKSSGHTVGMTGDGVNDVLALREADVAIAVNDGSEAARNVADMIMMNSDYASLPDVVMEGRNAINNLERSASLFLVKTIYSIILGIAFLFFSENYPFVPIQMTLINALTVAFPSLVLSLMRSRERIHGNFLQNALLKALPTGAAVVTAVVFLTKYGNAFGIPSKTISMFCAASVAACTLFGIFWVAKPMNWKKSVLLAVSAAGYAFAVILFPGFFEMNGEWAYAFPALLYSTLAAGSAFALIACIIHFYRRSKARSLAGRFGKTMTLFFRTLRKHRIGSCSADSSFFMLLSFVPMLILLLSLTSFFSVSADAFMETFVKLAPSVVGTMFERIVRDIVGNAQIMMTPLSAIIVLWAASRSVYSMIRGLNTIYGLEETRPIYKVRTMSILFTVAYTFVLVVTLIILVFSSTISEALSEHLPILSGLFAVLSNLKMIFGILYLSLFFCFLYLLLPNRKGRFADQIPGALLAAAGWSLFSLLFSYFVDHFSNYANIYGSLTAIVVFMLWTYSCLYILFIGAEFNLLMKKKRREWNLRKRFTALLGKLEERLNAKKEP